jgi:hypothetical protein
MAAPFCIPPLVRPGSGRGTAITHKGDSYIQIGQETGQREWNLYINCPTPELFPKTYFAFKGRLDECVQMSEEKIREVLQVAARQEPPMRVFVVFEASSFGQKFGRDVAGMGGWPVQLNARRVECIAFRKDGDGGVDKNEKFDSSREANAPLDSPSLPYVDVQTPEEEELRTLNHAVDCYRKTCHRLNAQICALLRCQHLHGKHYGTRAWEKLIEKNASVLPSATISMMRNHLEELKLAAKHLYETRKECHRRTKQARESWTRPDPAAKPPTPGRHGLLPLPSNSPLLDESPLSVLQRIHGIGPVTVFAFLAMIGDIRRFKNRKAFRAFCGLAPRPYISGTMRKSLGMKRGNPFLRRLFIELAHRWLREQPDTDLAQKYKGLMATRRSKKIAIAALAGKLSEMIHSYLMNGRIVEGLKLKKR